TARAHALLGGERVVARTRAGRAGSTRARRGGAGTRCGATGARRGGARTGRSAAAHALLAGERVVARARARGRCLGPRGGRALRRGALGARGLLRGPLLGRL